jgi:hypothetical protein
MARRKCGTTEDSLKIEKWGNAFHIFTLTSMIMALSE